MRAIDSTNFVIEAVIAHDHPDEFPFSIPAIRATDEIPFKSPVTFFIGENGSGKSTLIESIAVAAGFNAEGGSKNFLFETTRREPDQARLVRLIRSPRRPSDGYFLRAESFFNVATEIDRLGVTRGYGGASLHAQSHGESFMALLLNRLHGDGLYIFDEPEAALSPTRQLSMIARMHELVTLGSQFIIATHSPLIMAYPLATIFSFGDDGVQPVAYEETEHYQVTRDFLTHREKMLRELMR
jgi:predicted ATPase